MRRSINITLLAYCVCVFIFGWALFICMPQSCYCHWHNYFLVERFSIPPYTLPPSPSQIPSSKNPNESRNNGKKNCFFCLHRPIKSVSFNDIRPSTCSWFHSPSLPAMYPVYLSIKFLSSSSKSSTNPQVQPIVRHSFIRSSIRNLSSHTSTEPSSDPCNHTRNQPSTNGAVLMFLQRVVRGPRGCCWIPESSETWCSRHFEGSQCLYLQGQAVQDEDNTFVQIVWKHSPIARASNPRGYGSILLPHLYEFLQ
jgi:hypothetical protein